LTLNPYSANVENKVSS